MANFIVGLTGGIGSGKTAVSDRFAQLGIDVIDADVIARQIVEPGQPALDQLVEAFGSEILLASGELNRMALRARVFANNDDKQRLNAIMHPAIRNAIQEALQKSSTCYTLLVAPLLLENGLNALCHRVLVVDVPETLQIERASKRDTVGPEQIQAIMNSQMSRAERITLADDIITNDSSMQALYQQVAKLDENYRLLAKTE